MSVPLRAPRGAAAHSRSGRARRSGSQALLSLAVLVLYGCLSVLIYGHSAVEHLQSVVVGFGPQPAYYGRDQSGFVWCLAWGLHELQHLRDPLSTRAIFAPYGYNLAWAASIQGPALLISPLTALAGAVASYDVLALAAPATAAWCAYLLCRHGLARSEGASIAGGLLFGFGTYETVETINHVNLALVALLPLAALLALLRLSGRIARSVYVICLGLLLLLQLWTSTELLASMIGFGALALGLGALLGGRADAVGSLALESLAGLALAGLLGIPFLYQAFAHPNPAEGVSGARNGTDLSNLLGPTRATWISWLGLNAARPSAPEDNLTEQVSYVGVPLLALLASFAVELRASRAGRIVGWFMLVALVASLGSHLIAGGSNTGFPLPWDILGGLPLLRYMLPARLMVYLWLGIAAAVAMWLDRPSRRPLRLALLALVLASLLPNVWGVPWGTRVDHPALPSSPELARYVPRGSTVLALPFGINGNSMYWQVQAGFAYRTAGGYVGLGIPRQYLRQRALLEALSGIPFSGEPLGNLCAFLRRTGSRTILLRRGAPGMWGPLLDPLRIEPAAAGGFLIYRVAPALRAGGACSARALPPQTRRP